MNLGQLLFSLYERELLVVDEYGEPQIFPAGIQEIRRHAAANGLDMSVLSDCRVQERVQNTNAYLLVQHHHIMNQIPQAGHCVIDHREMIVAAARGML